jgi:ATP-dependent helicase/nuclease subunit B
VQPPAESTWAGYAQWAIALVDAYVSPGTSWPTIEIEANDVVHDRLAALEAFDRFDVPVDGLSFAAAVEAELDAPIGHQGRVGTGVFVGPPSAMRGLSFDTVFIVGAADGRVPSVVQPDPILPDAVRTQWGLPAIAARAARERREYLVATAAATKALVVSYPRADPRATQSLEPSPWVAELPREVLPSYAGALARAPHAVGFDELVTQELLRAGLAGRAVNDHPAFAAARLAHGYATIAGRRSAVMTEFDGLVERDAQRLRGERFYSSTGLQDFVDCPFRYFLKSVLHVQSVDRPESADTIEPRERGNLLHQVLERFFGERVGAMPVPTQAWSAADHAALQRIATACITEFEQEGRVGQPGLWKFEQRRVRRELAAVLETDSRLRAELGLTPTYFEASFGSFAADEDAGPTLPPVEIQIDADTTMRFRGRIDRIDRTEEDGLMVLDYKTGKQSAAPLDESRVDGGRRLQLAIYGLAARGFHPTGPVRAAYWYTRESIATNLETIDVDAVTEEKLHEALSCTASAIRAGTFPMIPGDEDRNSYQHCRYCDYQRLCPGDRAHQWERKQDDPALEPVITLVTLGEKPAAAAKAATP